MQADRIRRSVERAVRQAGCAGITLRGLTRSSGGYWLVTFEIRRSAMVKREALRLIVGTWETDDAIAEQALERIRQALPLWLEEVNSEQ